MNAPVLLLLSIIFLAAGYNFYGKFLLKKFDISDDNITPANSSACKDGCDFVAAKNPLILFGHHFSSIAGAGPILGPIIAASAFGWRALARQLVGKIPLGGGLIPKAAIAWAGTFAVGLSLERLYRLGYGFSRAEREAVYKDAYQRGREVAGLLLEDLNRRKTA